MRRSQSTRILDRISRSRNADDPVSEKLFLHLRSLFNRHPAIHFVALSHCTSTATDAWIKKLSGAWNVNVVVDQTRELYALWGLWMVKWRGPMWNVYENVVIKEGGEGTAS